MVLHGRLHPRPGDARSAARGRPPRPGVEEEEPSAPRPGPEVLTSWRASTSSAPAPPFAGTWTTRPAPRRTGQALPCVRPRASRARRSEERPRRRAGLAASLRVDAQTLSAPFAGRAREATALRPGPGHAVRGRHQAGPDEVGGEARRIGRVVAIRRPSPGRTGSARRRTSRSRAPCASSSRHFRSLYGKLRASPRAFRKTVKRAPIRSGRCSREPEAEPVLVDRLDDARDLVEQGGPGSRGAAGSAAGRAPSATRTGDAASCPSVRPGAAGSLMR